jgi:hypothetical protein
MAAEAGALIECYLESARSGELFAPTGSLVLSGGHHQAWNYVHARATVRYIVLGAPELFASSMPLMGETLVQSVDPAAIYTVLLAQPGVGRPAGATLVPVGDVAGGPAGMPLSTYLYPDLCFGRQLGCTTAAQVDAWPELPRRALFAEADGWLTIDGLRPGDDHTAICQRIAERWRSTARGVAFGDPLAIRSQLAWHCRAGRVAFWAPRAGVAAQDVQVSDYTEDASRANAAAGAYAESLGVPFLLGRQTCDGDLMAWSRRGLGMEIIDPCRPPLPVVEALPHPWPAGSQAVPDSPTDAELEAWADARTKLVCVLVHSGEIAHNEAMLLLCELAERTGVALGLGACVGRYSSCPQQWEMIATARKSGGFKGLVEPVLYGNGWGIMAEALCPEQRLAAGLHGAMAEIRRIAGPGAVPRGHYSFLDTDLQSHGPPPVATHRAFAAAGLAFDMSSARPGRCRVLRRDDRFISLNQSCRTIHVGSPYVRIQDPEDLGTAAHSNPGWLLAALDAPVVAFQPAVWSRGTRILELFKRLAGSGVAATPSTIARYAQVLARRKLVPVDAEGLA